MKKNLRLLCLGLAALTFNAGFAQAENVTSKLRNANLEEGIRGWGVEGTSQIFGKVSKSHATKNGYHGVDGQAVEMWIWAPHGTLADGYITQNVKNLPNGTYVFGAYAAASLQGTQESNKEDITGITLFANENVVPVATDDPDKNDVKWAHTAKFNVAATVAEGGDLHVGLKVEQTNANFTLIDNATLYYFPGMSEAEALNEMAKIDIAATIAIADTCFAHHMQVDTLVLLNEAKAAAQTLTTADQLWQLNEDLYWAISRATKSISDYRSFNNVIAHAEDMANTEWSAQQTPGVVDALNALIVSAKATYEAATAGRPELNEQKAALNEAAALVALDSCYVRMENLQTVVDELEVGEEIGEYSEEMIDRMEYLLWEVNAALDAVANMEMSALAAQNVCDSLFTAWQFAYDNPITVDAFPFTVGEADGTVATKTDGRFEFTSKVYNMERPVTNLRFTFLESYNENGHAGLHDNLYPYVAIAEFYLYDGEGNQIELTVDNFSTNAQEASEGPMVNICDGDKTNFWHSQWNGNVGTYHYLEIAIPDGLDLTSFSFGWTSRYTAQVVPKTVEVTSVTTAGADLESALNAARGMHPVVGSTPGFYKDKAAVTAFNAAFAAAEALVGTNASDSEIYEAIGALETAQGAVDELPLIMPEAGKKYRIVSGAPFFAKQGVVKALSMVKNDTIDNYRLTWETASADSAQQVFTFEYMPNSENRPFYIVKHEQTGRYISEYVDFEGEVDHGGYGLIETADTVELLSLGYGQFALQNGTLGGNNSNMIHANNHASGAGTGSNTVKWATEANNASAWFIREMSALPCATKSITDLNFESAPISLYAGVNCLTLTADKDCAFADFVLYDVYGNEIASSVNVSGAVATVVVDSLIETFSFAFTTADAVTVTINGFVTSLSALQDAYDAAVAVNPTPGEAVLEYKDLSAYNAALKAAEAILASGGSDEEIEKAIAQLEEAVAGLTPNMPEADKTYFIVSAVTEFEKTHGVPMMLYVNTSTNEPRWMYENYHETNRLWVFELDTEVELEEGAPAQYYIRNVATGGYFTDGTTSLVADKDGAISYAIKSLGGTEVAFDGNNDTGKRLHANGHGGGSGKGGNIVYWNAGFGSASAWHIYEYNHYLTDIDFTEIDGESGEQVAPAVKGIFDLFGRRIVTPAATGIYIVDGKKVFIKQEQK